MTSAALALPDDAKPDLRVAVIEDPSEFAAMRDEWNALLTASDSDCLFLTWEWLHTWWLHLGPGKALRLITVRSGSHLIAVAPLVLTRGTFVSSLNFIGNGFVGSDYLDVIIRRGCEEDALPALSSAVAEIGSNIRLTNVKEDSAIFDLVLDGWKRVVTETNVSPYNDLTGATWDSYLASVSSSHRYNFRRRLRNLNKAHTVRFVRVESEQERSAALKSLVDLHMLRWNPRGGTDAFHLPELIAFHDAFSRLALELGWLRLYTLMIDGAPAASFYCFRYGRTFYFYQSGLDPAFEKQSVGLVTMGLTIQNAIEEGAAEFDFLHGDEAYKSLWTSLKRPLFRIDFHPPTYQGHLERNVSAAKGLARRILGRH